MTSSTCMGGHVRFQVPFVVTELGLSARMFVCCPLSFILFYLAGQCNTAVIQGIQFSCSLQISIVICSQTLKMVCDLVFC